MSTATHPAPPDPQHQPHHQDSNSSHTRSQSQTSNPPSASGPSQSPSQSQTQDQTLATSAFTASLHSLGANYTSSLVSRSKTLHENSQSLSNQEAELAKHTEALRKQNESWSGIADEARTGLKEIGDVQNWAEMIERDLLVVEDVLGVLEEEEEDGVGGGFEGGRMSLHGGDAHRVESRGSADGDVDMINGGLNGNLNGNAGLHRDGKVDGRDGEDGKGKGKGKGKAKEAEKKGWFSWWW